MRYRLDFYSASSSTQLVSSNRIIAGNIVAKGVARIKG